MSLWLIEGFDTWWFKPGVDDSLVPIVPKWGLPIVPFAMSPTSENLRQLQLYGTMRAPMNVATKLPTSSPLTVIVGARFNRTAEQPALLCSIWEGMPAATGSRLLGGVMVASDGSLIGFQGGTWDRDAAGWGLSGQTNIVSIVNFTFPLKTPFPDIGNFWEARLSLTAAGQLSITLWAYDDNDQGVINSGASSGTVVVSPAPNMDNIYLWVSSNYSYKDTQGNLIPMHALDDLYLVIEDGIYPSHPIGPITVYTFRPVRATVSEWNTTAAGHAEAVNEDWVSHPANDPEYVWTNETNRLILWRTDTPIYDPEPVVVGIQVTAWVNFQTLPPSKLALVTRWLGSETVWQPRVGTQSDVTGLFGFITKVFPPFVTFHQLNDVEWGVMTVP
jgi:hypothetical protein